MVTIDTVEEADIAELAQLEACCFPKEEAADEAALRRRAKAFPESFLVMKKDGVIITNTRETMPMPVITGAAAYPENIVEKLKARANVVALDAMVLALEAGNAKAVNMVLMGVLAARMDLPEEVWQAALTKQVPAKFLELNRRAFALGQAQKGV